MQAFDLLRPKTVKDAIALLGAEHPPVVKAGGVDLLDRMKEGIDRPTKLLDLLPLAELRGIEETTHEGKPVIRIGALTTLAEVAASPLVREKATALAQAAAEAATPQIRAQATVGGNLLQRNRCWYYRSDDFEPCLRRGGKTCFAKEGRNKIHAVIGTDAECVAVHPSNLATACVALEAIVEYRLTETPDIKNGRVFGQWNPMDVDRKNGAEPLPYGRSELMGPDLPGLLVNVLVPIVPGRRSAYVEFGERESFDWALASCAVTYAEADGKCTNGTRIVLGAVAPTPLLATAASALLREKKLTPKLAAQAAAKALEGAKPLAENGFKVPVARALVKRALLAAAGMEETK